MIPAKNELLKSSKIYTISLLLLLFISLALGYAVIRPFLNTVIISIVLAGLFYPLSCRISSHIGGRKGVAAFLTVVIIVFAIIIPAVFFFFGLLGQGVDSVTAINNWIKTTDFSSLVSSYKFDYYIKLIQAKLPFIHIDSGDIQSRILEISRTFGQMMLTSGTWIAGNTASLFAHFLIMAFLVFSFLKDGHRIIKRVCYLSPLRIEQENFIITSLRKVSKSVLFGSIFIAMLQGLVGGIGLALVSIPALFWGTLMGFCSLIPVLGTGIVWVPALIYLLIVGKYTAALFLLLWCGILVTGIDTVLRPIIVRESSRVSTIYVFLSILGGINAFGALGLLYGPLVLTFLMVMLDIYGEEFKDVLDSRNAYCLDDNEED
ncbi:AI-2E family transporter [Maridesulfovibrio bastinii]|uniref:AI-2E family transporter n=1 Tax=Maridesulfovibrio bastinii TaxID=47157 RepID=UPI00040AFD11|nr:AI-2E family transporter [Maridesulfovibrio bastinii]